MNHNTTHFFQQLYSRCTEGYITLWERQNKETYWFHVTKYQEAAETALYLSEMKRDVYFGVGLRKEILQGKKRGSAQDILCIPGVWMDIDIKSNTHAESALPASVEEATQILTDFSIAPTLLVHSGHGLHAYWQFTEPKYVDTEENREKGKNLLAKFQSTLRNNAFHYGWKLDNTADLARVLRVPGTMNYKNDPVDVRILTQNTNEPICENELKKYCLSVPNKTKVKTITKTKANFPPPTIVPIQEGCGWLKHCYEDASSLPEPEWYAMLSIIGRCEEGKALAHEWSRPYPTYTETETNKKLDHALRDAGPATCKNISNLTNNIYCNGCKWQGVLKSPINIGRKNTPISDDLALPAPNLCIPKHYCLNTDGLFHITYTKNDEPIPRKISPLPLVITRRYKNIDTGDEKIEIAFYRDNQWNTLVVPRSIVFNSNRIVELSDKALTVSSVNAKDLVRYLTDFEAANLNMPSSLCVSRLGWIGNEYKKFICGTDPDIHLDAPEMLTKGYSGRGTVEEWATNVEPILQYDIARFMLASSFASPLLKPLGTRSFIVYIYGATRGGKTAATKAALSVWGSPEEIMISFNSTQNAVERKAAFNCNIPIGIDERQVVKDQLFVEQLIYMLANGQSRGRAKKDGTLQNMVTWQTITIATGEDSLTTDSTKGGVMSRGLEFFGQPIPTEDVATHLHVNIEDTYGSAGPEFMRRICTFLQEDKESLKRELQQIKKDLTLLCQGNINSHISAVSIVALADYYMNIFFFKKEKHTATDSIQFGKRILGMLQSKADIDDAKRSYEEFMSWYAVNTNSFSEHSKEVYGWFTDEEDYIFVYPTIFKKVMKELGFNERRMKQEWANREWIKTEARGDEGKLRFSVRKYHPITKARENVIAIKKR